jgi:hypothetical protein
LVVFDTNISVQLIPPIFKGQAVNMLVRNVGNQLRMHATQHPKEPRTQVTNNSSAVDTGIRVQLPAGRKVISLVEIIQIIRVNHQHSYAMGTGNAVNGVKAAAA